MNDSGTGPVVPEGTAGDGISCVPIVPHLAGPEPGRGAAADAAARKPNHRNGIVRRDGPLHRDSLFVVRRDDTWHVVSESYFYKTEPYYTILRHELEGRPVRPSSAAVLDAYVVPNCLERARLAGIPVCDWRISQGYAPLPSIVYGLNYFATAADYSVLVNNENAKETIKHITNKGKYPFCYQQLADGAEIRSCTAIFGRTAGPCSEDAALARQVYDLFEIPLVTLVCVKYPGRLLLSSLAPTKYSRLSGDERALLSAALSHQVTL